MRAVLVVLVALFCLSASSVPTASTKRRTPARSRGTVRRVTPAPAPVTVFSAKEAAAVVAQILLDRRHFSPNCIDGRWGRKSTVALATWCAVRGATNKCELADLAENIQAYFPSEFNAPAKALPCNSAAELVPRSYRGIPLFTKAVVTEEDVASLVSIPSDPPRKSQLPRFGYQTLLEMFAERGHSSETFIRKLNPSLDWPNPRVGSVVIIPNVAEPDPMMRAPKDPNAVRAAAIRVSIPRLEVTVFDSVGRLIALFPCSIAAQKAHLPPPGEIHVKNYVPHPNYTYKPDVVPAGEKVQKYIYQPGPNNPVGDAWIGLSLPGYGIHGTPFPERIGNAESHGCFRLANWNAVRLYRLVDIGTPIVIED